MLGFLDTQIQFPACHQMIGKLSSNNAIISESCEIFCLTLLQQQIQVWVACQGRLVSTWAGNIIQGQGAL